MKLHWSEYVYNRSGISGDCHDSAEYVWEQLWRWYDFKVQAVPFIISLKNKGYTFKTVGKAADALLLYDFESDGGIKPKSQSIKIENNPDPTKRRKPIKMNTLLTTIKKLLPLLI